ncbi:RNA polymerase sigma-factor [uncultured Mediterranean phage uvMED]|nr:RNA polymerase sigma-factor [uncultured Mediterranean phage uvMED]
MKKKKYIEKLSDKEIRTLLAEMREIDEEASVLREKAEALKVELKYNQELEREIRWLESKSQRIKAELIDAHFDLINGCVGEIIKKHGMKQPNMNGIIVPVAPRGFEEEDLKSEGLIAFQHFLKNFDISKDSKFRDTAYWVIEKHVLKSIGRSSVQSGERLWAYECLQKLVHVRRQEEKKLGREVNFKHVCAKLNIPYEFAQGLLGVCIITEPLFVENDNGDYICKADFNPEEDDYDSSAEQMEIIERTVPKVCKDREGEVLALSTGSPGLHAVYLDEFTDNFPEVKKRIKEIEEDILSNITDEGLVQSAKNFFRLRSKAVLAGRKPSPELLKKMGLKNDSD